MELSSELVREHAYLIARGVRPLALVGTCEAEPAAMQSAAAQLENAAEPGAIPFVLERGDGLADFGFAAGHWALDLFRWVSRADSGIPACQVHRVRGLLLGYGVETIRAFDERTGGRNAQEPVRCSSASPSRGRRWDRAGIDPPG